MAEFAERGFDGATVETIARRARSNKALINYHFGGKEGLYKAILIATFGPIVEELKALRASTDPPDVLIRRFIGAFGRMAEERPGLPAMILREVLSGGRHLDEEVLPLFLSVFATVREIVARGIRDGSFRPVDPFLTHLGLVGSLVFFFATAPLRGRLAAQGKLPVASPAAEAYLKHIQEIMARGLAADRRASRREEEDPP